MLSTREDHIAPWASTYAATQLYRGKTTFVLAGSGHIAGIVNPPTAEKYGYWTNPALPADPEGLARGRRAAAGLVVAALARLERGACGQEGGRRASPGDGALAPIEDAPGSYVGMKVA